MQSTKVHAHFILQIGILIRKIHNSKETKHTPEVNQGSNETPHKFVMGFNLFAKFVNNNIQYFIDLSFTLKGFIPFVPTKLDLKLNLLLKQFDKCQWPKVRAKHEDLPESCKKRSFVIHGYLNTDQ